MPFSKLNLPLKIQRGTYMFDDPIFFLSQYFECKQAEIEWILIKVSNNYCLQISRPGEGGWGGFSYLIRSKRYMKFRI